MNRMPHPTEIDDADDAAIIGHLRAALDDITQHIPTGMPADHSAESSTRVVSLAAARAAQRTSRAKVAAASAAAIVGIGAIGAVVMQQTRNRETPVADTPSSTASVPPTPVAGDPVMRYGVIAADLAPGRVIEDPTDGLMRLAWASAAGFDQGLIVAEVIDGTDAGAFDDDPTRMRRVRTFGEQTLLLRATGITADEFDALVAEIVPGSGVPFVLPTPGWTLVAVGPLTTPTRSQTFGSADVGAVTLTETDGPAALTLLAEAATIEPAEVAGQSALVGRDVAGSGSVVVVWAIPGGESWAKMVVDPLLVDRLDALLLTVIDTATAIPADSVAPPPGA